MPKTAKKSHKKRVKRTTPADPHYHRRLLLWLLLLISLAVLFIVLYKQTYPSQVAVQPTSTSYTGTTPCADCSGIKTTLTLSQNPNTYALNLVYEGKDTSFTEKGTWNQSQWKTNPNKMVYTLTSTNGNKTYYEVLSPTQIRQLDGDGNEIPSSLPFTLTKTN